MPIKMKRCKVCGEVKPLNEFHKNGKKPDGTGYYYRTQCILCYREYKNEMQRKRYREDPEYREARNKASAERRRRMYANDEEYRLNEIIRRHKRRVSAGKPITTAEWLECVEAFDNSCAYCGTQRNLTMEHVTPVAKGGTNEVWNIIPACGSCNLSKGDKDIIEWYTSQPFYSEDRLSNIIKYLRVKGGDANAKY